MTEKEMLIEIARKFIENDYIRDISIFMLEKTVPKYFWEVPASSSGKYHPTFSQGQGGLARHTVVATLLLIEMLAVSYHSTDRKGSVGSDCMIASIIFHDTAKLGSQEDYDKAISDGKVPQTRKDHPLLVEFPNFPIKDIGDDPIIKYFGNYTSNQPYLSNCIVRNIKTHMGQWGPIDPPANHYELIVHLADYLSSRKNINVDVDAFYEDVMKRWG